MNHMRCKYLILLGLTITMLFSAATALAETGTVKVTSLILRKEASTNSDVLRTLKKGEELEILSKNGSWYKVKVGKQTGYVYGSYIKVEDSSRLEMGDSGTAVKNLQERLKTLGYFEGACTDFFGEKTKDAVKEFQKQHGLTVDGVAGKTTLDKLYSTNAQRKSDGTLRLGDSGTDVNKLQKRLKELGYFEGNCTNYYGDVTKAAVTAFQKKNGLTANGIADKKTQDKIYAATPEEKEEGTLRFGVSSSEVNKLQKRLKELGYFTGICTNYYGEQTKAAVTAFQTKNGLKANGIANQATLNKIYAATATEKDDGTLRYGMNSTAVNKLQKRLKELGYFEGICTNFYGEQTKAAVTAFQKKNGLTANGIANKATLDKIYAAVKLPSSGNYRFGDSSAVVKALQERLKELGYFTGSCTNYFGTKTQSAVVAFQKANGLTSSGEANTATLTKLNSSTAISKAEADKKNNFETERLDWFKYGENTFPRKAVIKIKDCWTGLVFNAQVLYGTNHLDAEPLTAADTKVLLKVNGGVEFSYHRRPVLVQYNGHVYAASIYSEPHGSQTILDNNFNGQFCLHFYGSMTHGTDRVDEDHRDCEALALKFTW